MRGSARSVDRAAITTTRGGGRWRVTRRSSAGSARSTRVAWPIPASSDCRAADGLPRSAECADSTHTQSISRRPCSSWWASRRRHEIDGIAQSHLDGTSFAYFLGDGGLNRGWSAPDPALRDARLACHLPRRVEGGDVPPGRSGLRRRSTGQLRRGTTTSGSSTTWPMTFRSHVTVAAELPEKVAELVALWWEEARHNDVLPLDNRVLEAIAHKHDRRRPQADLPLLPGRGSGARVGRRRRPKPLPCH